MSRYRQPSLKALKAFETVSRHLHVNQAAEELFVTSSAISHLIRQLEQDLGVPLTKRSGRNIALTEAGLQFAPGLQKAFRQLTDLVEDVRHNNNPHSLTVSSRPYFAFKWLSPRLSKFWLEQPDIELQLIHTNQTTDFSNERVDLAIEWLSTEKAGKDHLLLIPGELTPVISPDLMGPEKIRTPGDLLQYTLLKETDYDSWQDWFALTGENHKTARQTLLIDDSNVRYQAAINGQGVELGCRSLVYDDLAAGKLIAPFELSLNSFSYYLVIPKNRQPKPAAEKFIAWLRREVNL